MIINNYEHIISLGFDCTVARFLKHFDKKQETYPFDWVVSQNWNLIVDSIIKNHLNDYIDVELENMYNDFYYINKCMVEFLHHSKITINDFQIDFQRRIDRFYEIIKSDKNILFIRKTHDFNNCKKTHKNFNEIEECVRFCNWLRGYNKKFKFILFTSCTNCHNNINLKINELEIISKIDSIEKDCFGYYNKDIENFIKNL